MIELLGFFIFITPLALFIALTGEGYGLPAWFRILASYLGITFIVGCFCLGALLLL